VERFLENYISRYVKQVINDVGDEIELEIVRYRQYRHHYSVIATICQNELPFKDYIGFGKDYFSRNEAVRKAVKELYTQAYSN
jgi:hypothetical protein